MSFVKAVFDQKLEVSSEAAVVVVGIVLVAAAAGAILQNVPSKGVSSL